MLDIIFLVGIIALVVGLVKRSAKYGKWLILAGGLIVLACFFVVGYTDFKEGFFDALRD